jgi:branched-chain amino acid transport system permease protein/urea transport system permease protein
MDVEFIVKQLLNGLSLSVILALIALGLSVIFGLMRILNMAHGEFFILGGYALLWVTSIGLTFWVGLIAAPLAVGVLGFVLYQGLLRRLAVSFTAALLATWGLSIIIRQLIQIVAGPRPYSVDEPFSGSISIGGLQYPAYRAFIIVAGVAILTGTVLLYYRTSFGLQIRAAIHNREMAAALGIDTQRINGISFFVGAALAGLAGALLSPLIPLAPFAGLAFLVDSFFVILVGGVGSVLGTPAGGLVIGGGESMLQFGVSPLMADILILVIAVAIVSFRPQGLFGQR